LKTFATNFARAVFAAMLAVTALGQSQPAWVPRHKVSGENVLCLGEGERATLAERARFGDAEAQDKLGTQQFSECAGANDPSWGIELLTKAALQGNSHAQLMLGKTYQQGGPIKQDMRAALTWFERSAEQGNARAENDLGVILFEGNAIGRDETKAARLFQAAAEQGLRPAAYNLGVAYDRGQGVAQDYLSARQWYRWAGEHGDADAEYRLALLFEEGLGGNKDEVQARYWLLNAAEDGSNAAQVKLGVRSPDEADTVSSGYFHYQIAQALYEGKIMPKDMNRSLKFLEKSAEAGYPLAFLALGRMYARGDGVARNEAKAIGYLQTAIVTDPNSAMAHNALAWTLISAEDPAVRSPKRALDYAVKAVELSGGKDAYPLDTLAHVYIALGNLDRALDTESTASLLQPDNDTYRKTLAEIQIAKEKVTGK
jgi:TPR repeat protein